MRTLLLLTALQFGQAQQLLPPTTKPDNQLVCSLQGAESADNLLDSILFIWAAVERCGDTKLVVDGSGAKMKGGTPTLCAVDVSAAIKSVNAMINFILKAVQTCTGALQQRHAKCLMGVGRLTEIFAGLSEKSAGIVAHCPGPNRSPLIENHPTWLSHADRNKGLMRFPHKFAHCIVDVKTLLKSVLKATMHIISLKDNCQDNPQGRQCSHNILQVIGSFTEAGEYISGAIGHCGMPTNHDAVCGSDILGLLHELARLGDAGTLMSKDCALTDSERLFLESGKDEIPQAAPGNFMNFALLVFIPFVAVLSFVAGRRMAKGGRGLETQINAEE